MSNLKPDRVFDRRWTSYALAGGAMLAAPLAANATPVTITPRSINLFSSTPGTTDSISIDIDGDGTNDYTFNAGVEGSGPFFGARFTNVIALNGNELFYDPDGEPAAFAESLFGMPLTGTVHAPGNDDLLADRLKGSGTK